jgi:hypothetical protein
MRIPALMLTTAVALSACTTVPVAAPGGGGPISQGTTARQRDALEPSALKYIFQVAALEPAILAPRLDFGTRGVPPTWRNKVCPHLAGLPEQQQQYVVARVAQIAREVGVARGDSQCSPNLFIIVTTEPRELLQRMAKHNYGLFGQRGRPYLIDQFIAAPRPVRVWYNVAIGRPGSLGFEFADIFVIVDQTQTKTVSVGQLADYIAMVSLMEIKPDAKLQVGRSILTLFDAQAHAAPAGLTDWDEAFLRSLYSTWPKVWDNDCDLYRCSLQRMAFTMASDIVP